MYIRMIFIMLISLYTSRIVLEVLGVDDFGIYSLVGGIVSVFTIISASLSGSVQRFLNMGLGLGDLHKTRSYFAQSLTIFVLLFVVFLIIGESVGLWIVHTQLNIPPGREVATFWVYQFSLIAVLFAIIQIPFSGVVIARERLGFFAMLGIADVCARLAVVLLLNKYGSPDNLILYAAVIALIQILLTLTYIVYAGTRFKECVFALQWDRKLLKEMLSFMGLSFFGNTIVTITSQGVNILLNIFFGAAINAARGVAQQVNVAVLRMIECINTPIKPQIVKSYAARDFKQMLFLFEKNTKYSSFLMLIILFPLILEARIVLSVWLKEVPAYAVLFTQIVLLESLFSVFSYGMAAVISATGKLVKMEVYGRLITLSVLPVAYVALKADAHPAIPLVISLGAQVMYVLYLLIDLKAKTGLKMRGLYTNVLKPIFILVTVLAICCIPEFLFIPDHALRFFIIGFTTVLVGGLTVWFFGLDASEKQFVKSHLFRHTGK